MWVMRLNDRRRVDWKSACKKVEEIKEQKTDQKLQVELILTG
jgi:hypothetical protein